MSKANPKAVAERYMLIKQAREINARSKTAGRVKPAKFASLKIMAMILTLGLGDNTLQVNAIWTNHTFNQKCNKNIAKVLRSTLSALGHSMSAYATFAKIKSETSAPMVI